MNHSRIPTIPLRSILWIVFACVPLLAVVATAAPQPMSSTGAVAAKPNIDVGYAIVTPTSTNKSGLVVFETFGAIRGLDTTQAGVLPSTMTTRALLFVSLSGRLGRNLGVAIANPGAATATITLTLHNADGTPLATASVAVPSLHQTAQFVSQLFAGNSAVPKDFSGTMVVSSDEPVAIVGLRFRGVNFSTLPATNLAAPDDVPTLPGGAGGVGAVILAQFAAGGGWASEIVIVNSGTEPITVRVDLFKQDGTPFSTSLNNTTASSFTDITIEPDGVFVLSHKDADGDSDF